MTTLDFIRSVALSFEATNEEPHFERTSFRVKSKIFATFSEGTGVLVLKFSEMDQSLFVNEKTISPVKGKWGLKGWTSLQAAKIESELLENAIKVAYCTVAPKRLSDKYQPKFG